MSNTTMKGTAFTKYHFRDGSTAVANALGFVQVPTQFLSDQLDAGMTIADEQSETSNGLSARRLSLTSAKTATGLAITATPAAGEFTVSRSLGTNDLLVGEDAQNNTKTDTAVFDVVLPPTYAAGADITVTVQGKYSGAGTVGATKTVDVNAYKLATAGTAGSDLCTTAAQTLTGTLANYAFTLAGASLSPGDVVQIAVVTALQETGNVSPIATTVSSVVLS